MTLRSQPFSDDLPERPKVLLVDDDEVNLLLTSVALARAGFAVTEATGGEQAIRSWPTGCPTSSCSTRSCPASTASRPAASCASCPASSRCRC